MRITEVLSWPVYPAEVECAPFYPERPAIPAMPRSKSSNQWLSRHLNDPFVKKAQVDGYRSRSAYKLVELNTKDRLIKPGMRIMDLGSAPGGWSQVAGKLVGAKGRVLATDILPMSSIAN